jgi:L-threonylcarbamoyladenylate synthase
MKTRQTEIVVVNPVQPEAEKIEHAASLLRAGEVVVFPTETVYGLGADALQVAAVERIFEAKGRPFTDPLIVHIAKLAELEMLVAEVPERAKLLAEAFWPGPLTLLLPKSPRISDRVTAGLQTIGVRMPRHPIAHALISALGSPIAAPSANRFMHVSPTTAAHVYDDLHGRIPLILDGGPSEVGVESTVLDLSGEVPTILRPGGISLEDLRRVLPLVELHRPVKHVEDEYINDRQLAPGQMLTHYAPAVPLLLFDDSEQAMRAAMLSEIQRRQVQAERVGVLIADEDRATFESSGAVLYALGSVSELEQVAARLFAGLRSLETAGVQVILCRSFGSAGLGLAIRDRLLKAASSKVVKS